jgi:hypothetical protein
MYKVFNHWKGVYEEVDSIESAKARYKEFIDEFICQGVVEKIPAVNQVWDQDRAFTESEYIRIFEKTISVGYAYTVFDIENGIAKSRCFAGANSEGVVHLLKVGNQELLEVYELSDEEPNQYSFTYDLVTKQKKYKYFNEGTSYIKKDAVTNEVLAITNTMGTDLPEDKKALLDSYPEIKQRMFQHAPREYGYVVEYYEDAILVDNPELEAQKAAALADIKSRTNVIIESADEAGLITTQVVDTTDW